MDANTVLSMIGSVGFPIVACVGLFYYMTKQQEQHQEESKSLTNAINELKIVLAQILTKLGGEEDE